MMYALIFLDQVSRQGRLSLAGAASHDEIPAALSGHEAFQGSLDVETSNEFLRVPLNYSLLKRELPVEVWRKRRYRFTRFCHRWETLLAVPRSHRAQTAEPWFGN